MILQKKILFKSSRIFLCMFALFFVTGTVTIVAQEEGSALDFLSRADSERAVSNYYAAIEDYLTSLKKNPAMAEAMVGLAECYYALGEYEQADIYVKKALPLKRMDYALKDLDGFVAIGLKDLTRARTSFTLVLKDRPNDLDARFGLALLDLANGNKTQARSRLEESLRIANQDSRSLLALALIADSQGEKAQAQALIERSIRYHGDEARVQYTAAQLAKNNKQIDAAIQYAKNALAIKADYLPAQVLLASLLYTKGDYAGAIAQSDTVLKVNRDDAATWFTLGLAQIKANAYTDAVYSFNEVLRRAPDDELARLALEDIVLDTTRIEDSNRETYANKHFARGKQFEEKSFYTDALFEYRRGLKIYPLSKVGRELFAKLQLQLKLPARYLYELNFIREIGKADTSNLDDIEAYDSLLTDTVARAWQKDQYALPKFPYKIAVYTIAGGSVETHTGASAILLRYFSDFLSTDKNVKIMDSGTVSSFSQAFERARSQGTEYFIIYTANEGDRVIDLKAELYVTRTGSVATAVSAYRSGNDRIKDAHLRLEDNLLKQLPLRGTIIDRKADTVLVDLGSTSGIKKDTKLTVVRQLQMNVQPSGLGFLYQPDNVVGEITIGRSDEEIAEGTLKKSGFFDAVNIGDYVILSPTPAANAKPAATTATGPLSDAPAQTTLFRLMRMLR